MSAVEARRRARRQRIRRRVSALLAIGLLVAVGLLAFVRSGPLQQGYEIEAVVGTANQLRPGAAVRIAGIDVGRLVAIERGPGHDTRLRMRIDDDAPSVHDDAEIRIEPRLFFEGNAAVRISPGTPSRPALRPGAVIPRSRTSVAVQLDQVLDVLTTPVRSSLRDTVGELDRALGGPSGRRGGQALRRAGRELDGALGDVVAVERAVRGAGPGDLDAAISGSAETAAQLVADPAALRGIVTGTARVTGALASQDRALAASVRRIDEVLQVGPGALRAIDLTLPGVDRFSVALRPALREAPSALRSTNRALAQVATIALPGELPATLDALEPLTARIPGLVDGLAESLPLLSTVMRCVARNVVPTLRMEVPDGRLSTGRPVWQDALHMGAALAGASPNFDGNGTTIRLGVTEGEQALEGVLPGIGTVSALAPDGVGSLNPSWLGYGVSPPFRPDAPCTKQALPDLGARSSARILGLRSTPTPRAPGAGAQARAVLGVLLDRPALAKERGR